MAFYRMVAVLEYNDNGDIVTIRGKDDTIKMMVRLDHGAGTMKRIFDNDAIGCDCDNYWIGIKPSDNEVFSQGLFNPRNHIVDQNWSYRIDQYKKRRAE